MALKPFSPRMEAAWARGCLLWGVTPQLPSWSFMPHPHSQYWGSFLLRKAPCLTFVSATHRTPVGRPAPEAVLRLQRCQQSVLVPPFSPGLEGSSPGERGGVRLSGVSIGHKVDETSLGSAVVGTSPFLPRLSLSLTAKW